MVIGGLGPASDEDDHAETAAPVPEPAGAAPPPPRRPTAIGTIPGGDRWEGGTPSRGEDPLGRRPLGPRPDGPPVQLAVLDLPTSALGLPRQVSHALEEAGLPTVAHLVVAEDADLLSLRGIGRSMLARIRARVLHARPPAS